MLRSILVGIEDSRSGIAAQELSFRWAERFDARLTAIMIVDGDDAEIPAKSVPLGAFVGSVGPVGRANDRATFDDVKWHDEREFAKRCREAGVELELIGDVSSPHVQIIVEAQSHDIVVLGQPSQLENGRDHSSGEKVRRIILDCPRPVVFVPAASDGGESIVVAYDGSLQSSCALQAFVASGLGSGTQVHIVSVGDRQDSTRCALRAITFLKSHGIEAVAQIMATSPSPGESILSKVGSLNAGMVVMGAYGDWAPREFFLGSVTCMLLNESPVPIFCFH